MVSLARQFLLATLALPVFAAVPVLDDPVQANRVAPSLPVGKTLMFPITASDADGNALTFKVTSSNPKIMARVKTGNPSLRLKVDYAGANPIHGDLVFQLFRDWTPIAAGFIGGFAQSGFYDGLKFHRVVSGFVLQGGDPLGDGSGGPGMTGSDKSTAFTFENELRAPLIFTGRGQLAMANSGINTSARIVNGQLVNADYSATNGSQFFISLEQLRVPTSVHAANLDFKHTIFGQLLRGWDIMDKIAAVPVADSEPTSDVVFTTAGIEPNNHDAVLVLSAAGAGASQVTVTVDDGQGGTASKTFTVTAVADGANSPPFLTPVAPLTVSVETQLNFPTRVTDLEFDYLFITQQVLAPGVGVRTQNFGAFGGVIGDAGFSGKALLGLDTAQFNVGLGKRDANSDSTPVMVGIGDRAARTEAVAVQATPGDAFSGVVGRLTDLDPAGQPADFTVKINWGDGTPITTATVARDTAQPAANQYTLSGTHTFAQAGIYTLVTTATGSKGAVSILRTPAIVTDGAVRAVGQAVRVLSAKVNNRLFATFTDTVTTGRPADYPVTIDWGDGTASAGKVIRNPSGTFLIRGTHTYRDAEIYAVNLRIHKNGTPASQDAFAWSTAETNFKTARHLPPFGHAHLIAAWNSGPTKSITSNFTAAADLAKIQVKLSGNFVVINSGNRASQLSKIRYWLSNDKVLDPGDTKLVVNGVPELLVAAFGPGGGGSGNFTITLPKGRSGGGKYLLSQLVYSDPIANFEKVDRVIVSPITPTILVFNKSGPSTAESGSSVTFQVVLDSPPTANVTIPLVSTVPSEGTVAPAQLVFTSANWNVPQTVTATGVNDTAHDGTKPYTIQLQKAVSGDTFYDKLDGPDVNLTNTDND